MGNEQDNNKMQAPTYNDPFAQVMQLREQIEKMKMQEHVSALTSTPVADFRMFSNLNQSVNVFDGRESTQKAKVWLDTIKGLAYLNGWPFNYRIQYVRSRLDGAALNWYIGRVFYDWTDFET